MNYTNIFYDDSKNGHGYRVTLGVSGCDLNPHCKNCFNSYNWDFNVGKQFTDIEKEAIINHLKKDYISGFSIIGGDAISNVKKDNTLTKLVKEIKEEIPNKTIYVWTGYSYEDIKDDIAVKEFLKYVDMLRDGRYIPNLKDTTQYLQGSKNQRCINIQDTLKLNKLIEYDWR